MNARTSGTHRRALAVLLLAAQLSGPVTAIAAATPPRNTGTARATTARKPHVLVTRALSLYGQARYDEAVTTLLGPVSRAELQGADLRDARIVLARCYVKKGLSARAEEHFKAVLAADPTFELQASQADAEELEAFRAVKPAPAAAPGTATNTTPAPTEPREKTPAMKAALPPASGGGDKKGWLSSHKGLALLVAVAGGGAAVALAGGGGGGGSTSGPVTPTVPDFPPPPNR